MIFCKTPNCAMAKTPLPIEMEGKPCPLCQNTLEAVEKINEEERALIASLPYIIAYPLEKTLEQEHAWTRINLLRDTLLNYLKYLGLLTATEFFNSPLKDKNVVASFYKNLAQPSFGSWNAFIRETLHYLKENEHDFFCKELPIYYEEIETGKKQKLYKGEIEVIDARGEPQIIKQQATAIGMLINFRNRYLGHGLTLDAATSEPLWEKYFPLLKILLEKLSFSAEYPIYKNAGKNTWILQGSEIRQVEVAKTEEQIWIQRKDNAICPLVPFFIDPGEVALGSDDKVKVLSYESFTGKSMKFFSPEGVDKSTSGRILERLNLILKDKQTEATFSAVEFRKELFLDRIEKENQFVLKTLQDERKVIPGIYQPRLEMETRLREWIGARAGIFFIAAEAGSGKTNLLAEIQRQYGAIELPSLLIRAGRMAKNTLSEELCYLMNIDHAIAINKYTALSGTQSEPTFVLVDGLNEAPKSKELWKEITAIISQFDLGTIKFVVTCRTNSKNDLDRFQLNPEIKNTIYHQSEKELSCLGDAAFWLSPMDMVELEGAWNTYVKKDKKHSRPLFAFKDLASFDRSLYTRLSNPLILRIFLETYHGKPLPKKGNKLLNIWKDWLSAFSNEEVKLLEILAQKVWNADKNELLLDDLLNDQNLSAYLTDSRINAPYQKLMYAGWLSRYTKDQNIMIGFTVEGLLYYLLGKLVKNEKNFDTKKICKVLDQESMMKNGALEAYLVDMALEDNIDLIAELIDKGDKALELSITPLLHYAKNNEAKHVMHALMSDPSENDWIAIHKLAKELQNLQLMHVRKALLKQTMALNPLNTEDQWLTGLEAVKVLDKEEGQSYFQKFPQKNALLINNDAIIEEMGNLERKYANYDKAIEYHEKSLAIRLKVHGDQHPDTGISYNNLGLVWKNKGEYDKAIEYHEKSLAIYLKVHGDQHPSTGSSYNNLGVVWENKGEYDKAISYYEKSLAICLKVHGDQHPSTGTSYSNLGIVWSRKNDHDKAIGYYEKSLAINLKVHGDQHPSTARSYNHLGMNCWNKSEYDKAYVYFKKGLMIKLKVYGDQHPSTGKSYSNLGMVFDIKGDYAKAIEYYEKGLAIFLKVYGDQHPNTAQSYNNLGGPICSQDRYDKAIEYYEKSLAIYLKVHGDQHPDTAESYNNLGLVYRDKEQYDKAIDYFEKALSIRLKVHGDQHPETVDSYNNLILVWSKAGEYRSKKEEYDKAIEYYEKALAICLNVNGDQHLDTELCYNNLGNAWNENDKYDKAIEYYEKSLEINLKLHGDQHLNTARSYSNVGLAWKNKGEYDKAIDSFLKTLKIETATLGAEHPDTGQTHFEIGVWLKEQKNFKAALEHFTKGFISSPDAGGFPYNMGVCYEQLDNKKKALNNYLLSAELRKKHFGLDHEATQTVISDAVRLAKELDKLDELPNWIEK